MNALIVQNTRKNFLLATQPSCFLLTYCAEQVISNTADPNTANTR